MIVRLGSAEISSRDRLAKMLIQSTFRKAIDACRHTQPDLKTGGGIERIENIPKGPIGTGPQEAFDIVIARDYPKLGCENVKIAC